MQIDFVLPWVDGNDPAWRAEKAQYAPDVGGDARDIRFRDWGNLHYWFRGVERFAPWVNRVHLITWGHLPEWLNADHPKLNIVRHADYIPPEYLPTFSSHPIELNIHRIEGLSDRFVYFNDDIFLLNPVREQDFFRRGVPVDSCGLGVAHTRSLNSTFMHVYVNNTALINRHLNRRACQKLALRKWLSPKNGRRNLFKTLTLLPWPYFTGFSYHHLPVAYEKRTFLEIWNAEPDGLDATCRRRFRTNADLSQLAARSWRLAKGEFMPGPPPGTAFFFRGPNAAAPAANCIRTRASKMICLNDDAGAFDFEEEKKRILDAFEAILPEPCACERR